MGGGGGGGSAFARFTARGNGFDEDFAELLGGEIMLRYFLFCWAAMLKMMVLEEL